MEKWMYEKYLGFTKEKSAEELTIEYLAYSNIECSDRAFANNFEAGMNGCYLNELFENLSVLAANTEETKSVTDEEKEKALKSIIKNLENYEDAYKSVKQGIREINNDSRFYDEIRDIKKQLQAK
jgi:hypothetical protein